MSRGLLGLDRAAGDHLHLRCFALTFCLVLAGLTLTIGLVPNHALAEPAWQELWTDSFDHSMNEGWVLETWGTGDRIGVVPEGFEFKDRGAPRCANNVLYGRSPNHGLGHGFSAQTPGLIEMGLHPSADAYSIEFRYMVLNSDFCWTVPLASPDLTLVVSECTAGGQRARLGFVSKGMTDFQAIAELDVSVWHDFAIHVRRLPAPHTRVVTIMIDGEFIDRIEVNDPSEWNRGIAFMDLPALPYDVDAEDDVRSAPGACFGSGYWDDLRFRAFQEPGDVPDRSGRIATLDPNPFNPVTDLCTELQAATRLEVTVFDLKGRRIQTLHSGIHPAGPVRLRWDGRDARGRQVSSGVYLVRVMTPDETRIARGVLVR